jgi:hypothetical protein
LVTSGIYKIPITILPIGVSQTLIEKGDPKVCKPWTFVEKNKKNYMEIRRLI